MKKPWRGDKNNVGDDEELQDPEVYFSFAVSSHKLDTLELDTVLKPLLVGDYEELQDPEVYFFFCSIESQIRHT